MLLKLFAELRADDEIDVLIERGRARSRARDIDGALGELCAALLHVQAREETYLRATALLAEQLEKRGLHREALSAAWYGNDIALQEALVARAPAVDRGRSYALWAEQRGGARELHRRAAAELENAGVMVRAAIEYEKAEEIAAARALWSRLSQMLDEQPGEHYTAGLSRFNLARMCRIAGDQAAAHQATVAAVCRVEQAADGFESLGQRERAFDCYHVLIGIGELTNTFEHVMEGSVNAIRILREDHLRHHALRLYDHAVELAARASEHAAAATLAQEMTAYAKKQGLPAFAARGLERQIELWQKAADDTLERQGSTKLAENALVASLLAAAEAGRFRLVGATYERLAALALQPARRRHYARAAARYRDASDARLAADAPGEHVPPPDVWHVDLIEWEERGSAADACADVLLDAGERSDCITRRTALVGRLVALAMEAAPRQERAKANVLLADYLAPIGLYGLLAPLERLYQSSSPAVRRAAVRALGRYYYKRTFVTLESALRDPDTEVFDAAVEAVGRLRFDHAFDPLSRIYRTASRPEPRFAALRALARIDVTEAAELMLDALEHGSSEEREVAMDALAEARGARFVDVARGAWPDASERLRGAIRRVLERRGLPPPG